MQAGLIGRTPEYLRESNKHTLAMTGTRQLWNGEQWLVSSHLRRHRFSLLFLIILFSTLRFFVEQTWPPSLGSTALLENQQQVTADEWIPQTGSYLNSRVGRNWKQSNERACSSLKKTSQVTTRCTVASTQSNAQDNRQYSNVLL